MSVPRGEVMFGSGDKSVELLRDWWKCLDSDRGGRAELRRAADSSEVVFAPGYHRLVASFAALNRRFSREKLAAVAGLIARIKTDTGDAPPFPAQMAAQRPGGKNATVSGLRFRRLLVAGDLEDLYPMMIRVLSLLGGEANLADLARSVYWWNESTRKRWAYEYYAAAPSEP